MKSKRYKYKFQIGDVVISKTIKHTLSGDQSKRRWKILKRNRAHYVVKATGCNYIRIRINAKYLESNYVSVASGLDEILKTIK